MRVLVTGASGLVGSRLLRRLAAGGHEVLGVARAPGAPPPGVSVEAADLAHPTPTSELCERFSPELIVHAAAMTDLGACERDPPAACASNVEATANVARAARKAGAHLVHLSTDYVFDGAAGPYREEDVPNPRGVYPLTKRASEEIVLALVPGAAIARTAIVFSHPPSPARLDFGNWLVENLASGRPVRLFSDQLISPTLAESAADMVAEIAERRLEGIWHTAGATVLDRVSFGRALCERFGFDPGLIVPTRMADVALEGFRPARAGLRTDKAAAQLAAAPLPIGDALDRFHQQWRGGRR